MLKKSPWAVAAALAGASVGIAVPALAQAPAPAPAPAAAPAAPPPNYNIQYGGLFDGYYLWQFNAPKSGVLPGRFYDFRQDTPTVALGELNVFKVAKPGGFGFKTTLGTGDIAEINGGATPGGAGAVNTAEGRYKSLMQAYGTYLIGSSGAGIDFGKFYTPIGYEVTESNGNFNETHSVPFGIIPFYHFGVRAYTPSYSGLVLTGYVVNAVYNTPVAGVQNDTKQASFVGNATWTDPKGKWVAIESVGFGTNKYNLVLGVDPNKDKVTVSDTDLTYNFDANNIGGLDYTYTKTDPDSKPIAIVDSGNVTDNAWAVYYKHILTPKTDCAFRYSGGDFKADAFTNAGGPVASASTKPWEATATYEIHPASNFTERLEYQHSESNVTAFADSTGALTKKSQDTLEVAGIFTF